MAFYSMLLDEQRHLIIAEQHFIMGAPVGLVRVFNTKWSRCRHAKSRGGNNCPRLAVMQAGGRHFGLRAPNMRQQEITQTKGAHLPVYLEWLAWIVKDRIGVGSLPVRHRLTRALFCGDGQKLIIVTIDMCACQVLTRTRWRLTHGLCSLGGKTER